MAARKHRKSMSTPKGEAALSLGHVKVLSNEISKLTDPGHESLLGYRFNDFLRAARTVTAYLRNEGGRDVNLKSWVISESAALEANDPRYAYLLALRNISSHDLNVKPDRSDVSVTVANQLKLSGNSERVLRDKTGRETARVYSTGPPGTEVVVGTPEVEVKYFLSGWPNEDIATFCVKVTRTLADFVDRAYAKFS